MLLGLVPQCLDDAVGDHTDRHAILDAARHDDV